MPTLESDAAGSTPRTASRALALVAWRYTKSLSPACLGTTARTWSWTASTSSA